MVEVEGDWDSLVKEINSFAEQKVNAVIIDMSQVTVPEKVEKKCRDAGVSALLLKAPLEEESQEEESQEERTQEDGIQKEETQEGEEENAAISAESAAEAAIDLTKKQYPSVIIMEK